ncbi:MAG: ferritin [Holosporaceae bacterium]|jgi:ferritin|nr:ferritin [Holosporaceae bacterium]
MAIGLGKRVYDSLNKQITDEFALEYLYIAMSSVFNDMGLEGCASWMMAQSKKKNRDAFEIYQYLQQRNAKIRLMPIAAPKQEWRAPLHIFEEMIRNAQKGTTTISAIYEMAISEKDYPSQHFILELVNKQTRDEAIISAVLDRLRKMQTSDLGVLMFDAELGKKV